MTDPSLFTQPMLVSAIILGITFIGLFLEEWHGHHKLKFILPGAVAMLAAGMFFKFYTPTQALGAIAWDVVLLLAAMMVLISVMSPTGGFTNVGYAIVRASRGNLTALLILLGLLVSVLSMFLANLTVIVLFAPLVVMICRTLKVTPVPFLLVAAMCASSGGAATSVGDATSVMISAAKGVPFLAYFLHAGPMIITATIGILGGVWLAFRKELGQKVDLAQLPAAQPIKDKRTWYGSVAVLIVMIVLFGLSVEPWLVALGGLAAVFVIGYKVDVDKVLEDVEMPLIFFLIGLFILIGGVEESGLLGWMAVQLKPLVASGSVWSAIGFMWIAAAISAVVDNIPFTAAMIPIVATLESQGVNTMPLWWGLAAGVGLGGNGTHIGSAVNVFASTMSERVAKQAGDHSLAITPGVWLRRGTPAAALSLLFVSVLLFFTYGYFQKPIEGAKDFSKEQPAAAAEHAE